MREIKLRMWSPDLPGYFYGPDQVLECLRQQQCKLYDFLSEGFLWEQFTGRNDKNGREIYEGDRVKALNGYIGIVSYNAKYACFEVAGYYDQFADNPTAIFEEGFPEIIGNIHENPEPLGHNPGPSAE